MGNVLYDADIDRSALKDQRIAVPRPYMPVFVRPTGDDMANNGLDPTHALQSISAPAWAL